MPREKKPKIKKPLDPKRSEFSLMNILIEHNFGDAVLLLALLIERNPERAKVIIDRLRESDKKSLDKPSEDGVSSLA